MGVESLMAKRFATMAKAVGERAVIHTADGDIEAWLVRSDDYEIVESADYIRFRGAASELVGVAVGDTVEIGGEALRIHTLKPSTDGMEIHMGAKA